MSKEPSLTDLKGDYENAKSYHQSVLARIEEWRTILLAPDRNFGKNRSKITPKVVKKQAEWTYPILEEPMLSSKEMFDLSPVTYEDPEVVRNVSKIINHQFNKEIDKVKLITDATRRFVDDGTCIIKIGWDRREKYHIEEVEEEVEVTVEDASIRQKMLIAGYKPVYRKKVKNKKVVKELVKNAPYLEVLDPAMVIVDPNAQGDLDKAQFIIEEFDTNLSNLKKAGIYKNLDELEQKIEQNIMEETTDELGDKDDSFMFNDKARRVIRAVRYWGYWDFDGKGMTSPFVATWVGNILIHLERNPVPYLGLPFEVSHYKPVFKSNYGEPDAEIIKDNQEIIGAITRGYIDTLGRSASGQTGIQKGFMDAINKQKFQNREDYEYNPGADPKQAIHIHDFPELSQSALNILQMQENDVESLTGRKAWSTGLSGSSLGDTAAGVRSVMDSSAKREMGILRRFSAMFERIARKIISMNQVFLTNEQIIRITNNQTLVLNRDKDISKYDIKINIETPEAKKAKVEKIAFMLQTMGNNMPFTFTQKLLAKMYDLEDMPELAKEIREYKPEPDPEQELRMKILQAEYQKLIGTAQNQGATAQLRTAQAQETGIKAQKEMIEAQRLAQGIDRMDKFQEVGMKHKVDLAKERIKAGMVDNQMNKAILGKIVEKRMENETK